MAKEERIGASVQRKLEDSRLVSAASCNAAGRKRRASETGGKIFEDPYFLDRVFGSSEPAPSCRRRPRFMAMPKLVSLGPTAPESRSSLVTWDIVSSEFRIPETWKDILAPLIETEHFSQTFAAYNRARKGSVVLPERDLVFAWTRFCAPAEVKVIIVGQDPYPTEGDAHGLAFSVPSWRRPPPSLRRIFAALKKCYGDEFPEPSSGSLTSWASQGVLLLNRHLTVESGAPKSHASLGWDKLTRGVITALSRNNERMAVMLWGNDAKTFVPKLPKKHLRLEYLHPSTNTRRPFDCRHFLDANEFLESGGVPGIRWRLD
ncbi:Uracil-DNA glycosylase [Cacatuid alphaherpesvirus 2]|uniref:Uracil-DNA glycosylase n=1 Tax=Cacatuid alphaherpesvirus 2 TaxID=2604840 RepID=A0A5B9R007_9ALPH|nr:Uracil-DNA glycosylase [Cacatuid alphaherpesvirus 2]QEG54088.1 Uracil-DNA glycosylase [Cacatuid alphaherpesvirus 2]